MVVGLHARWWGCSWRDRRPARSERSRARAARPACGSAAARRRRRGATTPSTAVAPPTTTCPEHATTTTVEGDRPEAADHDLSGTPGVTPAEQTRAETLLRATLADLPKYDNPATAEAAGYRSIGDSVTGDEHYVKWAYVNDGNILDPKKPESLVYEWRNGKQSLVAAMYMLPFGSHFTDIPDVGGRSRSGTCTATSASPTIPMQKVVAGLTSLDGAVPAGHHEGRRHADAARVDRARISAGRSPPSKGSARARCPPARPGSATPSTAQTPLGRRPEAIGAAVCEAGATGLRRDHVDWSYRLFRGHRHRRARGAPNGARTPRFSEDAHRVLRLVQRRKMRGSIGHGGACSARADAGRLETVDSEQVAARS